MINHARTLLLNVPGDSYSPGIIGEEYIPPYKPITLSTNLQAARRILLGSSPERAFLNFRAFELLSLIHNTELAEFVYALDPRVTYWPQTTTEFYDAQKKINVTQISGTNTRLHVHGDPEANVRRGRLFEEYNIKLIGSNNHTAHIVITEAGRNIVVDEPIYIPAPTLGLSPLVRIPNSAISVQLSDYVTPIGYMLLEFSTAPIGFLLQESAEKIELESNTQPEILGLKKRMALLTGNLVVANWNLKTYARPESAVISCLPLLEFTGEPTIIELFGLANVKEPYATFRNIWFDSRDPSYRLAAFVLAMIYRTNELYYGR